MKKLTILSFLLSLFLVACGDDSSSSVSEFNEESELSSSSSSKANKSTKSSSSSSVKNKSSSSSSEKSEKNTENPPKLINKTISGMAQGPFEKGATVSVYELDENFEMTGVHIDSKTTNDYGEFSIKIKDFKSQYALLKVDGNLLDICTVDKTANKTTLYALTDLSSTKANINILTHLAHKRALYLVSKKNMTVTKAQKQAETEVLKSFNINEDLGTAKELDIFTVSEKSSALITISALMQGDLSKRGVKDFLTDYVSDIEKDGTWDDEKTIAKIADWAYERDNKFWGLFEKEYIFPVDNYSFKKHMNYFWQQYYGIGNCTKKRNNEIKKNSNPTSKHANIYFICKDEIWTKAKKDEVYPDALYTNTTANDGDIYWDKEYVVCYIYEDSVWRKIPITNCSMGLGGCTKLRKNDAEKNSVNCWYICDGKEWIPMDDYSSIKEKGLLPEKDFQNWKDTTEGAIRKGDITDIIYIFDNHKWRVATLPEASLGGCNEKTENFFGYVEERQMQDLIDPRTHECTDQYSDCYYPVYHPGLYICKKNYSNNTFYWKLLEVDDYFGACTESLLGTIKEVPVIETKTELDYLGDENYIYHSYVISIDSTKKRQYICRHRYSDLEFYEVINYRENRWHIASEIDIELAPKLCDNWWNCNGEIISGKNNNKYVCDFGGFRYATQEEIEAGIACTECMRDRDIENCNDELETETGMTCAEYKRHIEKCRTNK